MELIKAKQNDGFRLAETSHPDVVLLFKGQKLIMTAILRSMEDYKDEVTEGGNECACEVAKIRTIDGRTFVHWLDFEYAEDYLTELRCQNVQ